MIVELFFGRDIRDFIKCEKFFCFLFYFEVLLVIIEIVVLVGEFRRDYGFFFGDVIIVVIVIVYGFMVVMGNVKYFGRIKDFLVLVLLYRNFKG